MTTDPQGGDFNSSYLDATDFMVYPITVPQAGTYNLQYRVASPNSGGVVILGRDGTDLATTAIPNTGGWQNWQTISTTVSLQAGTHPDRVGAGRRLEPQLVEALAAVTSRSSLALRSTTGRARL